MLYIDPTITTSIVDFYERAAIASGYKVTPRTRFNCCKIEVASNIADHFRNQYGDDFCMIWACLGPKENRMLPHNGVEIATDFAFEDAEPIACGF